MIYKLEALPSKIAGAQNKDFSIIFQLSSQMRYMYIYKTPQKGYFSDELFVFLFGCH